MPLLRQQHAYHRDLLARATAETQTHANSAKDRHLMMTELMLDTCKIRSMSVLASRRQRYPLRHHVNVAVRQSSKAQDCVTKTIRDPFAVQFTHMPRGKIAHLAATIHHIDA